MGQLSCEDPEIEITNGSYYFGDLLPEQTASNTSQPFSFNVSENISNQQIEIVMQLTTDYGYEYEMIIPFDISGVSTDELISKPEAINLQNFPNPFNPSTTIYFDLYAQIGENAEVLIYNIKGQKIRQYSIFNNQSSIVWDGTDENNNSVSSGIYFYSLIINHESVATKRMILIK